ncbi:10016_t:CDS:2 [Entrophospora sp. SA101]|nr:10016_t:CDS:2 [Entrophospora sp. SA101]
MTRLTYFFDNNITTDVMNSLDCQQHLHQEGLILQNASDLHYRQFSPLFQCNDMNPNSFDDYSLQIKLNNYPATQPLHFNMDVNRNQDNMQKPPVYTKWTDKEDELLKEAVQIYGPHKWSLIATHVPNRTPMQCSARWVGALNPSILKGRWTTQEDNALRDAVNQYMMNSIDSQGNPQPIPWNKVSKCIPARTGAQCQARWTEALDPRIKKGKWSPEEDEILKEGVRLYGRCWIRIAEMITGRTQRQCLMLTPPSTTPSTPAQSIKNVVTSLPSKPSSTSSSLSSSPVFSSPSSSLPSPTSNIQGVIMRSSPTTNNGGNISGHQQLMMINAASSPEERFYNNNLFYHQLYQYNNNQISFC